MDFYTGINKCVSSAILTPEVRLSIHSLAPGPHRVSIYHWPKPYFRLKSEHMRSQHHTHTP